MTVGEMAVVTRLPRANALVVLTALEERAIPLASHKVDVRLGIRAWIARPN